MYVIYSGEIGIVDHDVIFATMGKGDIFGELALLDSEPRSATALAKSDVLLFRIDQDDFYDLMEERDELLRSVLRILCQRIRAQNDKLKRLSVH
jgi:CRP-like cAMP-binding protein